MFNFIVFSAMAKRRIGDVQIREEGMNNQTDLVLFVYFI